MSSQASSIRKSRDERAVADGFGRDIFASSATPFVPAGEKMFSGIEPRAVGSVMVLLALIGGLGFGGYSILQEVQKVQFAPVEQAPTVLAEVDPLAGAGQPGGVLREDTADLTLPSPEALDRLYRPEALEVPRLIPRDGPIVALDASEVPAFGTAEESVGGREIAGVTDAVPQDEIEALVEQLALAEVTPPSVQVTETPPPQIAIIAACEAWVRVRTADGSTIYEATMQAGDSFVVPQTEQAPEVRVGQSAAVYFAVNGVPYGPAGPRGAISDNELSVASLVEKYQPHVAGADVEPRQYADLGALSIDPCAR